MCIRTTSIRAWRGAIPSFPKKEVAVTHESKAPTPVKKLSAIFHSEKFTEDEFKSLDMALLPGTSVTVYAYQTEEGAAALAAETDCDRVMTYLKRQKGVERFPLNEVPDSLQEKFIVRPK